MSSRSHFQLQVDAKAREWLQAHPSTAARAITYDVHRCCGGGKICQVSVREVSANDRPAQFVSGALDDGSEVLIDPRAAARLPWRFGLTVRGIGPFKHLDLDLEGEQWGRLLYE